jgi:hypothetical protein
MTDTLADDFAAYLNRKVRYPLNIGAPERDLIDAVDWAIRHVNAHPGIGPYAALTHIMSAVQNYIDDREWVPGDDSE